jgi:hypothetical protein
VSRSRKTKRRAIIASKEPRKQILAFVDAVLTLEGHEPTPDEWTRIYGLFGGVRRLVDKSLLDETWRKSREYKAGKLEARGLDERLFRAFAEFGRLRDAAWKRFARESGYWSRVHELRKAAANPDEFRAAVAARKRKSRAKMRDAQRQAEPSAENDLIETVLEALDAAQ